MDKKYFELAKQCYKCKQYDQAEKYLQLGLQHNPQNFEILYYLGEIYLKDKKIDDALNCFETCSKINNKNIRPHLKLSQCYYLKNDDEKELKEIKEAYALDVNKKYPMCSKMLGSYYNKKKKYDVALIYLKEFLSSSPSSQEANEYYIRALYNMGQKEEALNQLDNLITNNKDNSGYYELKSYLLRKNYEFKEALKTIEEGFKNVLNSKCEDLKIEEIKVHYYMSDFDFVIEKGKQLTDKAIDLYSNHNNFPSRGMVNLFFYMGSSYRNKGNIALFQKYIEIYKMFQPEDNEEYLLEKAKQFFQLKKEKNKRDDFINRALAKNPNFNYLLITKENFLIYDEKFEERKEFRLEHQDILESYERSCEENLGEIVNKSFDAKSIDEYDEEEGKDKEEKIKNVIERKLLPVYIKEIQGLKKAVKYINSAYLNFFSLENIKKKLKEQMKKISCLNHINIIHINGLVNIDKSIQLEGYESEAIVMDNAEGGSLENLLQLNKEISLEQKIKIIKGIAFGIEYIHSKKFVHGNIKPSNILLDKPFSEQNEFAIKISDYGIYSCLDIHDSLIDCISKYSAPENFDYNITFKSDIYSFGVLIYEILTQKSPYENLSHSEIKEKIIKGQTPVINDLNCPDNIKDIIKQCLQYNPNNRPEITEIISKLNNDTTKIETTSNNNMNIITENSIRKISLIENNKVYKVYKNINNNQKEQYENKLIEVVERLTSLNHDNILKVIGSSKDSIILNYAKGGNLYTLINNNKGNIHPSFKAKLISQLFEGLSYLHSKNIVHGHLNPEAILLSSEYKDTMTKDEYPSLLITSYGLTELFPLMKQEDFFQRRYSRKKIPQQKKINKKYDVFSFVMICYFITIEEEPYQNKNDKEIENEIERECPPEPIENDFPNELQIILESTFQSCTENIDEIRIDINSLCEYLKFADN